MNLRVVEARCIASEYILDRDAKIGKRFSVWAVKSQYDIGAVDAGVIYALHHWDCLQPTKFDYHIMRLTRFEVDHRKCIE